MLAFKELPGIFENPYVIPSHVGKLSQYIMFYTVRESITVMDNSHHAPEENIVKKRCP